MPLQPSRYLLSCAVLGAGLLLSACGFQLRGTGVDSIRLDALHVSTEDQHSPVRQQLVQSLHNSGVSVSAGAPYVLQLLNEQSSRRALSYARRSIPSEYELTQQLSYQISNRAGQPLHGPETLTTRRIYVADQDNLLASSEEEAQLQREMRQDLVRQLMLRLSNISAADLAAREQSAADR